MRTDHRHIAAMIDDAFFLFIGSFVFFIDHYQT